MFPAKRAPISTTSASVPSGAPSTVTGTPISLLNDSGAAWVRSPAPSTAAVRSLVEVLPTDPVIATTRPSIRRRPAWAIAASATAASGTTTAGPSGVARSTTTNAAPRREGVGDEVVTVALAADRDEHLTGLQAPRVERDPVAHRLDRRVGSGAPTAGDPGHPVAGQVHTASSSSAATTRSSNSRWSPPRI